jgi:hypothetical protein
MANNITCTGGDVLLLTWALQSTSTPEDLLLKLFANNITPSHADTASTYTEASFTGYSAATLSRASWATPTVDGGKASTTYPAVTFTNTGSTSASVYGAYVVGATSGSLLWAVRFDTAPHVIQPGGTDVVTPTYTLTSAN